MQRRIRAPFGVVGLLAALLAGCTSFEVVRPPLRNADLYPDAQTRAGVTVAIDEMAEPARVTRYFGQDLTRRGIRPVQVIVSNQSDRRIRVGPADVLLLRGKQVVDPAPLRRVAELVAQDGLITTDDTETRIASYLQELALEERILAPGESYHGIVFFQAAKREPTPSRFFRVASLFPQPSLRLRFVATDVEREERLHFGPFGLHSDDRGI